MSQPVPGTTTSTSSGLAASLTFSCTTVAGQNFIVVDAGIGSTGAAKTVTGVTFDGVALTKLWDVTDTNFVRATQWYLANPNIGALNVIVSYSGSDQVVAGATPYSGVDTAAAFGTPVTLGALAQDPAAGPVTSDANSLVIGFNFSDSEGLNTADGTQLWKILNVGSDSSGCGQYKSTDPATLNWDTNINGYAAGAVSLHGTAPASVAVRPSYKEFPKYPLRY